MRYTSLNNLPNEEFENCQYYHVVRDSSFLQILQSV
jgi:hypothetical protein